MKFAVVVPARIGSTRLPLKMLRELCGAPLVQWTWRAARASGAEEVVVATDSEAVASSCRGFGARVRMTASTHRSGTDRAAEVAQLEDWPDNRIVVNLQGDEPLMPPALLQRAATLLHEDAEADIATLAHPLHSLEEWRNPNVVKLVCNAKGHALYFSRAPVPWPRTGDRQAPRLPEQGLRHMGLYAYRVGALKRFSALPPSGLELCESLEQLRALEAGMRIAVGIVDSALPPGVDTEADLAVVAKHLKPAG